MHMDNSFISTTMCDDLARATEAQDGKKNAGATLSHENEGRSAKTEIKCLVPEQPFRTK